VGLRIGRMGGSMDRHEARVRSVTPQVVDAGAMHKFAAPSVRSDIVLEAHNRGLQLQSAAARLDAGHAKDYRRTRRVRQLRRLAWALLLVALLLLAVQIAPVQDWIDGHR
jgi:ferric-dicitrate binding protein FerR (iron transport regulator)